MQAPPRPTPRQRTARPPAPERPRTQPRRVLPPLIPVLLAVVIAAASLLVAIVLLPLFGAVGVGANVLNDRLNAAGADFTRVPHFPERSTIYAADGSVLSTIFLDENRDYVKLRFIAPIAQKAVLAIEDDGFYQHGALDLPALFRAAIANLAAGDITQGGSTITQQLVKQAVIGDTTQTFARKFQEAALAIRMEQRYTKDQILELYLNEVYFGNGQYGIGTASQYYFGKPAAKLRLPQAALLAAIIRAPGFYDPIAHPDHARARRNEVLDRLAALGWVSEARVQKAKATPVVLQPSAGRGVHKVEPFFVYYIRNLILDMDNHEFDAFGKTRDQRVHTLYQGGLKIYTTLDPAWQRDAQEAVDASPAIDPSPNSPDVSLVSVDAKTGAIRAMLSGKDYQRDQLDLVWQGRRQVGSAFKPFTLVAAFENGFPSGKVYDSSSPYCDPRWLSSTGCVSNAEGGGQGYIDLWTATQDSVNVVFAQLALDVGPDKIVEAAHQMGITAPLDAVPAITLGVEEVSTLDMASAYSTLANDGVHCQPFAIARVELPGSKLLYRHKPSCKQVIEPTIAHLVTAMLQRVVTGGTGTAAALPGRPVAGKTGTAQDYTNVYFAGYTPQVATAVWVGFPNGQIPMDSYYGGSVFGGTVAAPIWHTFMTKAMAGLPVEGFEAPPAPESGKVPDVVGMRSVDAQQKLADANFTPIVKKVDSSQPTNTVINQTPGAGGTLQLGSAVTIEVSNGKVQPVVVPRVVGLTEDEAVKSLKTAGLVATVRYTDATDPSQEGLVVSQTPIGNKEFDPGTTVTITVAKSPQGNGNNGGNGGKG
jgi:penicillin-binding protein 1A